MKNIDSLAAAKIDVLRNGTNPSSNGFHKSNLTNGYDCSKNGISSGGIESASKNTAVPKTNRDKNGQEKQSMPLEREPHVVLDMKRRAIGPMLNRLKLGNCSTKVDEKCSNIDESEDSTKVIRADDGNDSKQKSSSLGKLLEPKNIPVEKTKEEKKSLEVVEKSSSLGKLLESENVSVEKSKEEKKSLEVAQPKTKKVDKIVEKNSGLGKLLEPENVSVEKTKEEEKSLDIGQPKKKIVDTDESSEVKAESRLELDLEVTGSSTNTRIKQDKGNEVKVLEIQKLEKKFPLNNETEKNEKSSVKPDGVSKGNVEDTGGILDMDTKKSEEKASPNDESERNAESRVKTDEAMVENLAKTGNESSRTDEVDVTVVQESRNMEESKEDLEIEEEFTLQLEEEDSETGDDVRVVEVDGTCEFEAEVLESGKEVSINNETKNESSCKQVEEESSSKLDRKAAETRADDSVIVDEVKSDTKKCLESGKDVSFNDEAEKEVPLASCTSVELNSKTAPEVSGVSEASEKGQAEAVEIICDDGSSNIEKYESLGSIETIEGTAENTCEAIESKTYGTEKMEIDEPNKENISNNNDSEKSESSSMKQDDSNAQPDDDDDSNKEETSEPTNVDDMAVQELDELIVIDESSRDKVSDNDDSKKTESSSFKDNDITAQSNDDSCKEETIEVTNVDYEAVQKQDEMVLEMAESINICDDDSINKIDELNRDKCDEKGEECRVSDKAEIESPGEAKLGSQVAMMNDSEINNRLDGADAKTTPEVTGETNIIQKETLHNSSDENKLCPTSSEDLKRLGQKRPAGEEEDAKNKRLKIESPLNSDDTGSKKRPIEEEVSKCDSSLKRKCVESSLQEIEDVTVSSSNVNSECIEQCESVNLEESTKSDLEISVLASSSDSKLNSDDFETNSRRESAGASSFRTKSKPTEKKVEKVEDEKKVCSATTLNSAKVSAEDDDALLNRVTNDDAPAKHDSAIPSKEETLERRSSKAIGPRDVLKRLERSDLEELVMLKISESLSYKSELGELRKKYQAAKECMERWRKKSNMFDKVKVEVNSSMTRYLREVDACRGTDKAQELIPMKFTRSVGLQVALPSNHQRKYQERASRHQNAISATYDSQQQQKHQQSQQQQQKQLQQQKLQQQQQQQKQQQQHQQKLQQQQQQHKLQQQQQQKLYQQQQQKLQQQQQQNQQPQQSPQKSPSQPSPKRQQSNSAQDQERSQTAATLVRTTVPKITTNIRSSTPRRPVAPQKPSPSCQPQNKLTTVSRLAPASPIKVMRPTVTSPTQTTSTSAAQLPTATSVLTTLPASAAVVPIATASTAAASSSTAAESPSTLEVIDLTEKDERSRVLPGTSKGLVPGSFAVVRQIIQPTTSNITTPANGQRMTYLVPTSAVQGNQRQILIATTTGTNQLPVGSSVVAANRSSTLALPANTVFMKNGSVVNSPQKVVMSPAILQRPLQTVKIQHTPVSNVELTHPAPLPPCPPAIHQAGWLLAPPRPQLKVTKTPNGTGIMLSWTLALTKGYEEIASYQLYAYQEGSAPPSSALWKKVGDVKALPLPMACTLTQFVEGHKYHFAVRAVDVHSRVGNFSMPSTITLK